MQSSRRGLLTDCLKNRDSMVVSVESGIHTPVESVTLSSPLTCLRRRLRHRQPPGTAASEPVHAVLCGPKAARSVHILRKYAVRLEHAGYTCDILSVARTLLIHSRCDRCGTNTLSRTTVSVGAPYRRWLFSRTLSLAVRVWCSRQGKSRTYSSQPVVQSFDTADCWPKPSASAPQRHLHRTTIQ